MDDQKITFFTMLQIILFCFLILLFSYYGAYFFPILTNYIRNLNYYALGLLNTYQGYGEPVNPFPAYQEGFKYKK